MTAIAWQEPEPGATWRIATLANGLRLVVTPMPQSQAASLAIYVGVGSRQEARRTLGLSHYLEHMLFKGTEPPGVGEVAAAIEGAGGNINAVDSAQRSVLSYAKEHRNSDDYIAALEKHGASL